MATTRQEKTHKTSLLEKVNSGNFMNAAASEKAIIAELVEQVCRRYGKDSERVFEKIALLCNQQVAPIEPAICIVLNSTTLDLGLARLLELENRDLKGADLDELFNIGCKGSIDRLMAIVDGMRWQTGSMQRRSESAGQIIMIRYQGRR